MIYDILPYILPDDMSELFQNSVSGWASREYIYRSIWESTHEFIG